MLFFIYGTDHYRVAEKLKEIKNGFIQKRDKQGLNVINIDAEKMDFDQFKSEVMSTPFLSDKKMIVVKNIYRLPQNTKAGKDLHKHIAEFLDTKNEAIDNVVCFVDFLNPEKYKNQFNTTIKLAGPLAKVLLAGQYKFELPTLSDGQLPGWINKYVTEKNITIAPDAVQELIIRVGDNLVQLANELDKLTAYQKTGEINIESVKNLVNNKFDDNIFELVDAIGQKNKRRSLVLLSNQINSGSHELAILTMIKRQFKILLQIKSGATSGDAGIHPFVFKKASGQTHNFDLPKLQKIYQELIEIESGLKGGAKNPRLLFDMFITGVCN